MIEKEFTNSPDKCQTPRSVTRAETIRDDVIISCTDEEGWNIIFDQKPTKVSGRECSLIIYCMVCAVANLS